MIPQKCKDDTSVGSPWDIGHIWATPARGLAKKKGFRLKSGHAVIELTGFGADSPATGRDWIRGTVTTWSRQSRARLMKNISAIDWDSLDLCFIVFTWGQIPPKDGQAAHGAVKAFWRAWRHRFGESPQGVWKKEFQKRGAIHYSMWLVMPTGVQIHELRRFVHETWYRIAGNGDLNHLFRGAHCQEFVGSPLLYLLKECFASGKEYQNIPPPGFHTGRWWGFIGGLKPIWEEQELTVAQGVKIRRVLTRYLKSKGYKSHVRSAVHGAWASMLPQTRARILEEFVGDRQNMTV